MAKDFAQRGNNGRQTSAPGLPGWVWLLAGVALGFAGAAGWYISRPADVQAALQPLGEKAANGKKKITIPPKEPSRFAFYELLPNYEVVIPKEALKPEAKAPPPAATGAREQFLIQVGSFRDRKEAEQQKASLALIGIESRVEKVTIDNEQTWFRVRIGPENDRRQVESILARLEENDIKGLVMMVPR